LNQEFKQMTKLKTTIITTSTCHDYKLPRGMTII